MGSVPGHWLAEGGSEISQSWHPLRIGVECKVNGGGRSAVWLLKRNCSMSPRQALGMYGALAVVSLGVAAGFWLKGATLVMPFAWIEVVAVGVALRIYARHAADAERIELRPGRLSVEQVSGSHTKRVDFRPEWVRVDSGRGDGSLIELSGQGKRVVIGRFVRPEMRRQLAQELCAALRQWPRSAA